GQSVAEPNRLRQELAPIRCVNGALVAHCRRQRTGQEQARGAAQRASDAEQLALSDFTTEMSQIKAQHVRYSTTNAGACRQAETPHATRRSHRRHRPGNCREPIPDRAANSFPDVRRATYGPRPAVAAIIPDPVDASEQSLAAEEADARPSAEP